MNDPFAPDFTAEKLAALLSTAARGELVRIMLAQDAGPALDDKEIDAQIELLETRELSLKRQARTGDFSMIEPMLRAAAREIGVTLPFPLPAGIGRQGTDLARALCDIEAQVVDGTDVRTAAEPFVRKHGGSTVQNFLKTPLLLSAAIARTYALYPSKAMKGNIDAVAKLILLHFGDVPVSTITRQDQERFFAWLARLPRDHGKRHGKNRFTETGGKSGPREPEKYAFTKDDEIAAADALDELTLDQIRGRNDLSVLEKRVLLAEQLAPRLTVTTLRRYRDSFSRVMKAAEDLGCHGVPNVLSYKDINRIVTAQENRDELYVRVTKPKLRMPWTEERLADFLTCPLFTGCASEHRRWRPGTVIIRDSLYWVPLVVLAIGSRIEEVLELKRSNFVYRNGAYCLALGLDPEQHGKTLSSERVIPIPQLLLDLGFVEWIQMLGEDHGPLLFPDAARRSAKGNPAEPFGKALYRILDRLDLRDFDEDFYALRKTFSSMLNRAGVAENQRQAIAGHGGGTVLNRHYTAHHTEDLKTAIDRADFKLEIVHDDWRGFPVIKASTLRIGW